MSFSSAKEEQQLRARLSDLARVSYERQIPQFSDFLGLNEQNIYHSLEKELSYASPYLFGGYENAERQMLGFLPDALSFIYGEEENGLFYQNLFPIRAVCISPSDIRFSKPLTHRDYLGAALHLGIERNRVGDILIGEEKAYLFCHESISSFLAQELKMVRHTPVCCAIADPDPELLPKPRMKRLEGSIASPRADVLIALAFHASRSSMKDLPAGGKVFKNGRMVTDPGERVAKGDIISVRGYGRFRYLGEFKETKKGRYMAAVELFI